MTLNRYDFRHPTRLHARRPGHPHRSLPEGLPLRCCGATTPNRNQEIGIFPFRPEACSTCGSCVNTCQRGAHKIVEAVPYTIARCVINVGSAPTPACMKPLKLPARS